MKIGMYVRENGSHECGHIVALFKRSKNKLLGLDFLPHERALDGKQGIFETATTPLTAEDCIALAASIVGELIGTGTYHAPRIRDDQVKVLELGKQPIEGFVLDAYAVIQDNVLFFVLLNTQIQQKMYQLLSFVFSLSKDDYKKLPDRMPVVTISEIELVYKQAESILEDFIRK